MECYCNNNFKNAIILVRGNDTNFNDATGIKIYINTTVLDLSTFKAVFKLGNITKTFDDISSGEIELNFTAAETAPLQAECWGTLNLIDNSKRVATIENRIPFKVISIVDGNAIATQPYTLNFDVKQGGETILNISIESAVTVEVGTTTTLPPGSEATVTNAGTPNHLILDFGIPRGYDPIWGHIEGDIMEQQDLQDELASISGGLADSITALDDKFTSITGGLDDKIDSVNGALSDSISGLDNKYDSITGALSDSITGLDNKYDSITGALSDSISAVDDKYNSITGGLSDDIDALESVVSANFTTLSDSISAETTARINADSIIGDSITALDNKYSSITGGLSDSITALDSVVSSNFTTLSDSIVALDSVVSDNYNTLDGKIDSINGALSDSITALDSVVSSNFTTLSDSIVALDSIVSDNFTTLSDSITNNYNALDSLIGGVDDKIDVHIADVNNPHSVTASQVGLGNVDNTSDLDKPVSTAQQTALDNKVTKNADITAATKCKITYDTKGLVTAGADLEQSDIPALNLTKISDVTATAAEVNILDGATVSTTELNYVDGVTSAIQTQFDNITDLIPAAASDTNQLTDKNFVNSSIATNTANFIGTFNSVADLEAYSGTLTNNDYAFVIVTDSLGNNAYDRYKYTTATTPASWVFEYELNNSSFTADQWAAINSLITADTKVTHTANTAIGNSTTPVYVNSNGEVVALSCTLATSVPVGAVFTDTTYTFSTGSANGAIAVSVNGGAANDIFVKGLGSAAYTSSSDYATSIQGGLADSAIQSIKVNGSALTPDANKAVDITVPTKISNLSDDTATYPIDKADTLTGLTATITELNYCDGVTSAIQTQLDGKVDKNAAITAATKCKITYDSEGLVTSGADLEASDIPNLTLAKITDVTASASELNILDGATLTTTELNYVDGVTSSIQTQLNGKQESIIGGASTITSSDLSASKALISNASGKVDVSTVTSTELGYISGVTSAIQTQLNGKLTTSDIVSSVSSSSTNSKAVGAKLFYDTIGNVESILQNINSGT